MLLRCPSCGAKIRLTTPELQDKIIRYLCLGCDRIVRLDLVTDEIPTSSASAHPEPVPHTARVLVADDVSSFAKMAEDLLAKAGYKVIIAQDGIETLKKISDEHPDVILLDLFMPKMTGFEVLKTLRTNAGYKNFRNIPVLVTSGSYNPAEIEILHDLGANGFISKEAVPDFLIYRISKMLVETRATVRIYQDSLPNPITT